MSQDWVLLSVIVLFIASIGYLAFVLLSNRVYVPRDFFEARGRGAAIAESIVALTGKSVSNLKQISLLDEDKDYSDGLDLVLEEIARNDESRKFALALSSELGKMAAGLSEIKPSEASDTALQAVIEESQIVQRLINYNDHIYRLLALLRSRFSNGGGASNQEVSDLISKMNQEISSINALNEKYKELMIKFDAITKAED